MEGQTATNPQTGEKIVFRGGQWQPMNTPAAPQAPGVIMGRPKAPTQLQLSAEQRAQEDQALQRQKFELDQRKAALDMQKTQRDLAPGADTTEGEKTAGFLATRVAGGLKELQRITAQKPDAAKPTFGVEAVRSVFGDTAANYLSDADRQQVVAAQTDILDAALTLGTGAAYTAEQLKGYRQSYFPQLGDDDATVKAKQQRLVQLLESAKVKAGRSAPMIDEALSAVGASGGRDVSALQQAFDSGASLEQIMQMAQESGTPTPILEDLVAAIKFRDQGGKGATILPPEGTPPDNGGGLGQALYAGVGDVAEGVGDVLGLVGNPLNAGINAIAGTNLSTDLGQTFRQATGAPEGNPLASAIASGGITALTGAGLAGAARPIATGVGRTVANALAQEPIRQGVAGAAAGASSELARQSGANPLLQAAAGAAGGVGAFGAASGVNALLQPRQASPLAQAAQRQNVQLMPADVGGPTTQRLTSAAAQGAVSSPSITRAAQASQNQFGAATQRATGGSRLAPDDAGEIVRQAGERFTKESRAKGGALYNRAEKMAQGVRIKAKGAVQTIDEQIAQLSEAGDVNAPLVNELTKFRNSLASNEGIRIGGMRDIRTGAQKAAYSDDLRSTPAQRVFGIVADAISQDIDAGLSQSGRGNAAQAFKTADAYWRDRVQYIDNVLEPIIGNGKSGEAVLRSVEDMAKGKGKGVQTLMKLMRSVDKEELSDIQATIIDRLGRASAGQQGADGNTYSAAQFLTRWNDMSGKGKTALFPDQNVRKNLDELAMIAESMKQSGKFANSSNTAGAVAGQVVLSGGLGMISPTALLAAGGAQYLSGRVLASPRFTRWLATVPKNPQAQQAHVKRLGAIASAEPIIANDIASIQRFLSNAPTSARAAATEGEQEGEERPIKP